jgi:hypothetical protein
MFDNDFYQIMINSNLQEKKKVNSTFAPNNVINLSDKDRCLIIDIK